MDCTQGLKSKSPTRAYHCPTRDRGPFHSEQQAVDLRSQASPTQSAHRTQRALRYTSFRIVVVCACAFPVRAPWPNLTASDHVTKKLPARARKPRMCGAFTFAKHQRQPRDPYFLRANVDPIHRSFGDARLRCDTCETQRNTRHKIGRVRSCANEKLVCFCDLAKPTARAALIASRTRRSSEKNSSKKTQLISSSCELCSGSS